MQYGTELVSLFIFTLLVSHSIRLKICYFRSYVKAYCIHLLLLKYFRFLVTFNLLLKLVSFIKYKVEKNTRFFALLLDVFGLSLKHTHTLKLITKPTITYRCY